MKVVKVTLRPLLRADESGRQAFPGLAAGYRRLGDIFPGPHASKIATHLGECEEEPLLFNILPGDRHQKKSFHQ